MGREISRRDFLKKGTIVGGAVLWITPVVQTVGMGRAFGQTELVSPGGMRCMSIHLTEDGQDSVDLNKFTYRTRVCNCGELDLSLIRVTTDVVALTVEGDVPGNFSAFNVQDTNIGNLLSPEGGETEKCEDQTFDFVIDDDLFFYGARLGDGVVYTMEATAEDSFGPVTDTQIFTHTIAS